MPTSTIGASVKKGSSASVSANRAGSPAISRWMGSTLSSSSASSTTNAITES